MRKRVAIAIALVTTYVVVSSVLHYVVFPEPFPAPSDLPRAGRTLVNEGIRSRFVCRQTSVETAGRLFEWDNFVEPGGGPCEIPHVHPHMREVFQILDGEVAFIINGREQVAGAGLHRRCSAGDDPRVPQCDRPSRPHDLARRGRR